MISLGAASLLVVVKFLLHTQDWEPIAQSSLQNGLVSGAFFVIGFILSATIADYKESERIPSEFSSILENMYEDAKATHTTYPTFDLEKFRTQLIAIGKSFRSDVRTKSHKARHEVHALNETFTEMEKAGVPANFIVKLKQQQAQLGRMLFRVNYIQNIKLIPSATILSRSIVLFITVMLLFTNIDPFYGSMAIIAISNFVFIYMLLLIQVISTPFHAAGKTRDDVSLFLVSEAIEYLRSKKPQKRS